MTHFGIPMLEHDMDDLEFQIQKRTGVEVLCADDGYIEEF